MYLLASFMLREAILSLCLFMNDRTQSGFVLLYSRKLHPIALLMKNSVCPKLLTIIRPSNSASVFAFLPSWWSMAIRRSQKLSSTLQSNTVAFTSFQYPDDEPPYPLGLLRLPNQSSAAQNLSRRHQPQHLLMTDTHRHSQYSQGTK